MATGPFVSIVIPTRGRPDLLVRAIESCLVSAPSGGAEVIVVVNGGDKPPRELGELGGLKVIELAVANANAARNAGLAAARGEYVRFLDDDDYLLPDGAASQYRLAMETQPDVCSGAILLAGANRQSRTIVPAGQDFVAAVLAPSQTTQPTAHLFRRGFLDGLAWDPQRKHYQDVYWMHGMARRSDPRWATVHSVVGVWQHHSRARISTGFLKQHPEQALMEMESILDETIAILARDSRLTPARRRAAAEGLWHCAHHGFPAKPLQWSHTARKALRLDPRARPTPFHYAMPWRYLHPLLIEWALLPKRRLNILLARSRGLRAGEP